MHAVVFANKPVAEHANKDCSWFSMDATFKIVPKEARLLSPRGSQVCYVSIINDQITLALLLTKTLMITNFPGSQHFGRLPGNSRHSLHDRHDRQESRSTKKCSTWSSSTSPLSTQNKWWRTSKAASERHSSQDFPWLGSMAVGEIKICSYDFKC